jgi:hypothetical protein
MECWAAEKKWSALYVLDKFVNPPTIRLSWEKDFKGFAQI